jgi:hypothetical protein
VKRLLIFALALQGAVLVAAGASLAPDNDRLIQLALNAAAGELPGVPAQDLDLRHLAYFYGGGIDAEPSQRDEFFDVVFCRRSTREVVETGTDKVVFYDQISVRMNAAGDVLNVNGPSHRASYQGCGFGSDGPALTAPLRISPRPDRRVADVEMIDLVYFNAPLQAVLQRFADIAEEEIVIERYLNPNERVTVDTYGPVSVEAALRAIVTSLEANNITLAPLDGQSSRACRKSPPAAP